METSKFNGNNVAKLDFNYFVRYRPRHGVFIPGMENQIIKLFNNVQYDHICYTWENDIISKHKHSHSLIQTGFNEEELLENLYYNVLSKKAIRTGKRTITYTTVSNLISPITGERIKSLVEKNALVDYKEIIGKHGTVFVEKIKDKTSASMYTMKMTDYGTNFGYIQSSN
jgi:hypothetical protein